MTASTTVRPSQPTRASTQAVTETGAKSASTAPWYARTWSLALASSLLLWVALSPLGWSGLAWVAPIGWLLLIRSERLTGWRPYFVLWCAGLVHWLLVLEGIRTAYWALYFGWIALAMYLACYLPAFVALTRFAVQRWRAPLLIAAPLVWVGLELFRGYFLTGFALALLGHTQVGFTPLIQVADLGGAYTVSMVVMCVAAGIAQALPWQQARWQRRPLLVSAVVLVLTLGYGAWRMREALPESSQGKPLRVALLQNSIDTIFDAPPERFVETCRTYQLQARDLARKHPDLDLMIWPESMFMSFFPQYLLDEDATVPEGWPYDAGKLHSEVGARQHDFDVHVSSTLKAINGRDENGQPERKIAQIVGTATYHFQNDKVGRYNAALAITPEGQIAGHYYKMHPVMFGEYIPLGEALPWIYRFTPMPEGLTRGKTPAEFEVAGYKLAPSICFESTVPHLIRRQLNTLAARGEAPDVLVNVTNDGWFWGSGILDLHYNCAVFRAVENHRPMLVAANTGFSVAVDGRGQVLAKGPRRGEADLVVEVSKDGRHSLYTQWGDWPLVGCLTLSAVAGLILNRRPRT